VLAEPVLEQRPEEILARNRRAAHLPVDRHDSARAGHEVEDDAHARADLALRGDDLAELARAGLEGLHLGLAVVRAQALLQGVREGLRVHVAQHLDRDALATRQRERLRGVRGPARQIEPHRVDVEEEGAAQAGAVEREGRLAHCDDRARLERDAGDLDALRGRRREREDPREEVVCRAHDPSDLCDGGGDGTEPSRWPIVA
jgi:hypothetical protein